MDYVENDAVIEGINEEYRYELKRIWDDKKDMVTFIMLNPSTADCKIDDPTIQRCVSLAKNNGFGGLKVVNLFAFRTAKPKNLLGNKKDFLIGQENDKYILDSVGKSKTIVLGWGNSVKELKDIKDFNRDKEVVDLLNKNGYDFYCADLTAKDCPKHPLFISSTSKFFKIKWNNGKRGFERAV